MTKNYKSRNTGKTIALGDDQFKAKGGEGSIFIVGDTVHKICEPGKMVPVKKLDELTKLNHIRLIVPNDVLLYQNKPVGYSMPKVRGNAVPLAQILTKSFREREGVTPDHMRTLVQQAAETLRYLHSEKVPSSTYKQYLQVDGNEFNYMVTEDFKDIFFIDLNSCQTPNFPADAIMPSVWDYHCPRDSNGNYQWTELSDWYSFAIISFYMFTAIHPFKGRHPQFTNVQTMMVEQMKACKSVLDPETRFPLGAVYHPFSDFVPGGADGAFMKWYRAIFVENKRMPAPKDFQDMIALTVKFVDIKGANNFIIQEIRDLYATITGYYEHVGREVYVTKDFIHIDNRKIDRPSERFRIGFTNKNNTPYAAWISNQQLHIQDLNTLKFIPVDLQAKDLMSYEGRIYVLGEHHIYEVVFVEGNNFVLVAPQVVASVLPNATTLFQGMAIQDMYGTPMISLFPQTGQHDQVKIPELSGHRIVEGKYERNVLQIVAFDQASKQYKRFILRFGPDWSYDVRTVNDINPSGINFTVLENGICVSITEEESVEIFSNQKGNPHVKIIDDPIINSDMRLCHLGKQVRFAQSKKMFSLSVKPT